MCVSIIVSILLVSYIQEDLSWSLGFGIPCLSMVIALLVFLYGTKTYKFSGKSIDKNPLFRIGKVYVRAARNWRSNDLALSTEQEAEGTWPHQSSEKFQYLHKALIIRADSGKENLACDIADIKDAKTILRMIPIWLSCLIYAMTFGQTSTFFTEQGKTMDRTIFSAGFKIPAASLQVFIGLSIVVFIPLYDRIFVPFTQALMGNQTGITTLQRIGSGIFISIATMVVASLVETKRLKIVYENGLADMPDVTVPMSVCWLIAQYLLSGISDVLAIVGLQEFFYDEVASDMKSLGLPLYLSVIGVGNFLSVFLIYVIEKFTSGDDGWFCNNMNQAHLDYYYWLLSVLSTAGLVVYVYFANSYAYR